MLTDRRLVFLAAVRGPILKLVASAAVLTVAMLAVSVLLLPILLQLELEFASIRPPVLGKIVALVAVLIPAMVVVGPLWLWFRARVAAQESETMRRAYLLDASAIANPGSWQLRLSRIRSCKAVYRRSPVRRRWRASVRVDGWHEGTKRVAYTCFGGEVPDKHTTQQLAERINQAVSRVPRDPDLARRTSWSVARRLLVAAVAVCVALVTLWLVDKHTGGHGLTRLHELIESLTTPRSPSTQPGTPRDRSATDGKGVTGEVLKAALWFSHACGRLCLAHGLPSRHPAGRRGHERRVAGDRGLTPYPRYRSFPLPEDHRRDWRWAAVA